MSDGTSVPQSIGVAERLYREQFGEDAPVGYGGYVLWSRGDKYELMLRERRVNALQLPVEHIDRKILRIEFQRIYGVDIEQGGAS